MSFTDDYIQLKEFIENGGYPTLYGNGALHQACEHGYIDLVEMLLPDSRVDSADCYDAICIANQYGQIKIVEALLQDGRVDSAIDDVIGHAASEEIKEMLIKHKYRVDGKEYCKMKKFVENGCVEQKKTKKLVRYKYQQAKIIEE